MGIEKDKQKILIALKKAKSSLEKVTSMVERDEYCIDIMQQNQAVIGLLRSVHLQVMQDHLQSCFTEGIESGSKSKQKKMIDEIIRVTKLVNR